jgi:hypothetical protein
MLVVSGAAAPQARQSGLAALILVEFESVT